MKIYSRFHKLYNYYLLIYYDRHNVKVKLVGKYLCVFIESNDYIIFSNQKIIYDKKSNIY